MRHIFQTSFIKEKTCILFIYFFFAALFSTYHKYFIHLSDTFQYLVIAENYSKGYFFEAINSYWSPLFSWILAGFLTMGMEQFSAIQIMQIGIGALALLGIFELIPFGKDNRIFILLLSFSFSLLVLSFALLVPTPDLLLMTISIWYLILISRNNFYLNNKYSFLAFGVTGALLYFAKGAGFVFFLLSFFFINLVLYLRRNSKKKRVVYRFISSMIVFVIISSCWIVLISKKEKKILFSSAPEYNLNLIGASANRNILGEIHHPCEWNGLIPPAQEHSINAWEEPQKLELKKWFPFGSQQDIFHYAKVILKNGWSIQSFYFGLDAGTALLFGVLFLWMHGKKEVRNIFSENIIPIIISASSTLPYIFVLVMERHIWINNIVIGIIAVNVFNALSVLNKKNSIFFILIFTFFTAYNPVKALLTIHDDYTNIFSEKENISKYISGNTASVLTNSETAGENYTKSTLINYLSRSKYYGMISVPTQSKNMGKELKKHRIRYLLSWNDAYFIPDSLYNDVIAFPKSKMKVYKLK